MKAFQFINVKKKAESIFIDNIRYCAKFDTEHKEGFTLAEVLITLGIIGIVAAMTLPTLISNIHHKELHTALNKAYTSIQSAVQKVYAEEGMVISNYTVHTFNDKFKSHFSIAEDCGLSSCFGNTKMQVKYKTHSNNVIEPRIFDDGQFLTQDGMFFFIENFSDSPSVIISVDVNGPNKNPNRWGYDLFSFEIMADGKILPSGAEGTTNSKYKSGSPICSNTNTSNLNGLGCTYRALYDEKYWKELP